jgi:stage II sporulation protein D
VNSRVNALILVSLIGVSCAPIMPLKQFKEEPIIRVLLKTNPQKISISSDFNLEIRIGNKKGTIKGSTSISFNPLRIITSKGQISNPTFPIFIVPTNGNIYLGGRTYPGGIKISKGSEILVVNHIPIEEYLKGVLPYEMGILPRNQIEALKAQAVAARSYAMANMKPKSEYDILSTIYDQVYRGIEKKDEIINEAVELTRGVVALYQGKIINAKYSSTCGGKTEDNENIWHGKRISYLRSVRDSGWDGRPFCRFSPHFEWERSYKKDQFFLVVKKQIGELFGQNPKEIRWIKIAQYTRTNRVHTIEIQTDIGKFYLDKDQIRRLFADFRGSIKSLMFRIKVKGNSIIISGRGYGHGVGMCQFGAMEMAKENFNYQQILYHYYTGIRLAKLW